MLKIFVFPLLPMQQGVCSNQLWQLYCRGSGGIFTVLSLSNMSSLCCLRTLHVVSVDRAIYTQLWDLHCAIGQDVLWLASRSRQMCVTVTCWTKQQVLAKQKLQMDLSSKASGAEGRVQHMKESNSPLHTGEFHRKGETQSSFTHGRCPRTVNKTWGWIWNPMSVGCNT